MAAEPSAPAGRLSSAIAAQTPAGKHRARAGRGRCPQPDGGKTWGTIQVGKPYDLWGSSANDLYVSGITHNGARPGFIIRSTDQGKSWASSFLGTEGYMTLRGLWGNSAADVYAVGAWGYVLHYN